MSDSELPIIGEEQKEATINLLTGKPEQNPVFIESMTQIICPHTGSRIRVWRKCREIPEYADDEVLILFKMIPDGAGMNGVIKMLSSIEGVTAVELVADNGCGAVVYFEW